MDALCGKWKLEDGDIDNFNNYMTALGVGMIKRQVATKATITQEISKEGDEYIIKTITGQTIGVTTTIRFKLGEEFEESTMDGRKIKTTVSLVDGKIVQVQPGEIECKITRELTDEGKYLMTLEMPSKNIVVKRVYVKNN